MFHRHEMYYHELKQLFRSSALTVSYIYFFAMYVEIVCKRLKHFRRMWN